MQGTSIALPNSWSGPWFSVEGRRRRAKRPAAAEARPASVAARPLVWPQRSLMSAAWSSHSKAHGDGLEAGRPPLDESPSAGCSAALLWGASARGPPDLCRPLTSQTRSAKPPDPSPEPFAVAKRSARTLGSGSRPGLPPRAPSGLARPPLSAFRWPRGTERP